MRFLELSVVQHTVVVRVHKMRSYCYSVFGLFRFRIMFEFYEEVVVTDGHPFPFLHSRLTKLDVLQDLVKGVVLQ